MRALEAEVVDAVWAAIEPLIPPAPQPEHHPLGCHRPRVADRLCFWGILIRLVTGCSWVSVEAILERQVSDTTLRARRDEWIAAGVFDQLRDHAMHAYDRIIGLDLREVALDGSLHKAPCGGEGTGPNPTDRAKLGWKWSVATDANGIPIAWAIDGANRNDVKLLGPTLDDVARIGLLDDIETLHLDRGYDYAKIGAQLAGLGLDDLNIQRRNKRGDTPTKQPLRLAALGRRRHQLVAVELRATTAQYRPANPAPPRATLPRRRLAHHRETHRLARPLDARVTPYPLRP